MKRIIYTSVISWLLFSSTLFAQTQGLDFHLYNSEYVQSIENRLLYQYHPFAGTSLDIKGQSSIEDRLNYNQKSKNSDFSLDFNIDKSKLLHSFHIDYNSIYDASSLEPSPYVNKTTSLGYTLMYQAMDSLSLSVFSNALVRNEQDRYIDDASLYSDGFWLGANGRYAGEFGGFQTGLSASAEKKKLAWEAYDSAQVGAYLNLLSDYLLVDTNINYNLRDDELFTLNAPSGGSSHSFYTLADKQKRNRIAFNGAVQYIPDERFVLSFTDSYTEAALDYNRNTERNNIDSNNQVSLGLEYNLHPRITLRSSLNQGISNREYQAKRNNRIVEARALVNRIVWEYADEDSLIASVNVDYQAASYPNDGHSYDNDLLLTSYRLGWKHYWHDRIKLGLWVGYSEREDVYLKSILSSNNKLVSSYSLQPDCQILIGDRIAFNQSYQLKADYNDYIYGEQAGKPNTFYRQIAYKYNLIFDSFPYVARSGDSRWVRLPFRSSPDNALLVDMGYAYEENQYADEGENVYNLHTKNRRYTASLSVRHDIRTFFWALTPKYTWGTWTEYSMLLGVAWQFNNASLIELSVSPYGESADNLDWRSSLNVNLRF